MMCRVGLLALGCTDCRQDSFDYLIPGPPVQVFMQAVQVSQQLVLLTLMARYEPRDKLRLRSLFCICLAKSHRAFHNVT